MIGDRIRELRIKHGDTQETLAKHLFVTAQAVSKWEQNLSMPDITVLVPLADYFGVTVDFLLRYDGGRFSDGDVVIADAERIGKTSVYCCRVKNLSPYCLKTVDIKVKFKNANGRTLDYCEKVVRNLEPGEEKRLNVFSTLTSDVEYAEVVIVGCTR